MRRWVAAVFALACLTIPSTAHAHGYPGEREWTGPQADWAYAIANAYWTARGLPGERPQMLIADSLCDTDGCTEGGRGSHAEHRIWIHASMLVRPDAGVCAVVTHEIGHERGLGHSNDPTSVMHITHPVVPDECWPPIKPAAENRRTVILNRPRPLADVHVFTDGVPSHWRTWKIVSASHLTRWQGCRSRYNARRVLLGQNLDRARAGRACRPVPPKQSRASRAA